MIPRSLWFVAGAGAGVWAVTRARRVAEAFTADGIKDRLNGLGVGLAMFREEVAAESRAAERDLRERYGLVPHHLPELTSGTTAPHAPWKREIN